MANYTFRCGEHGESVTAFPVGTAPTQVDCVDCGQPAKRVYTSPMMSAGDPNRMKLIDSTHASADRPEVVTSVPRGGRINSKPTPMAPPDPRLRKLPRP